MKKISNINEINSIPDSNVVQENEGGNNHFYILTSDEYFDIGSKKMMLKAYTPEKLLNLIKDGRLFYRE